MLYVMQETWDKSDYQFVRPPKALRMVMTTVGQEMVIRNGEIPTFKILCLS
ncbi:hypothetical protein Pint_26634 [Pistacia integerrima]|uniref:Uncharacterized protein n=1 Tax=Pistacia integerrima TaxID=434235 RepID=A0ACC0YNM2_9ROSI|nr:hypothetical protein Pint_26634 [Pistacia integerrima]